MDPKAQVELPLSPHSTSTSQIHEKPFIKLEPMPSLVPSTNPVESHNSPNKRSHSFLESTSPSKKLCQSPSQPLTEVVVLNASQEEMVSNTPEEFYDCKHGGWQYEVIVKMANSYMDVKPGETVSS